jgi:hypothetical protein
MAEDDPPIKLQLYRAIWSTILGDPGFQTPTGAIPDGNNQIRIDQGILQPNKTTVPQEGDLHEIELQPIDDTDDGIDGQEDENRPTFCEAEGGEAQQEVNFGFTLFIRHPDKRYEENVVLAQRARKSLRGFGLRRKGYAYAGNTSVDVDYDPEALVRGKVVAQHELTIRVACTLNPNEV